MSYGVFLESDAREALLNLDKSTRIRVIKKLGQLKREDLNSRHMKHGLPYFVEEAGQYRVAFVIDEPAKQNRVYFIGSHKEYEHWYSAK